MGMDVEKPHISISSGANDCVACAHSVATRVVIEALAITKELLVI